MQPNLQRDGGQGLPDVEGTPDVNSAGEGPGLEEGSLRGGGTGLSSKQRRGPSPKTRLGGPQGSPRAGFSLWTLRLLASGRSSER